MLNKGKKLLTNWNKCENRIASLYRERKTDEARNQLAYHAIHFKQALCFLNEVIFVESKDTNFDSFEHKPFNVSERIAFIENNTSQYHSYIQLNELFKELEKIYARVEVTKKRRDNHM